MIDANLQKYLAFVKTVELGSFSKAGQALSYSQSGISRMISDLEKDWKINLLERDRNGVRLTSEGTRLLPYARNLCNEYYRLQEQVDDLNGIQSGLIRIGTVSSVATNWLPRIIKKFQKDYPNISYEILLGDYTEIEAWIEEGRIDCGFLILPTRAGYDTVELETDELMAVIPENHPLAARETFPMKALEEDPFMFLEKGGKSEVTEIFTKNHLNPEIKFTTWDDYAIMSMIEQGLGISILPNLILRRIPYHVVVRPLEKPAFRTIGLAMKNRKNASAAMKKFLEYLDYRKE